MSAKIAEALALLAQADAMDQEGPYLVPPGQHARIEDYDRLDRERDAFYRRTHGLRLKASVLAIAAQLEATREAEPASSIRTCAMCHGVGSACGPDPNKPCGGCGGSGRQRV